MVRYWTVVHLKLFLMSAKCHKRIFWPKRSFTSALMLDAHNVCNHRPVDPLEIKRASLSFEFAI